LDRRGEVPKIIYQEPYQEIVLGQEPGGTILEASLANGIAHYHACGGKGRCTTCRVLVVDGAASLLPRTDAEIRLARSRNWPDEIRLACQARLAGEVTVRRLVIDDVDAELIYPGTAELLPGHDGHEASLAVMFCDIGNFTAFAAAHPPYDVVHLLNRYYTAVGEAILENHGYLDKYMGDGLMALFTLDASDARRCCRSAVRAGVQAASRMADLNRYAERHFGREFHLRIGLHYGPLIVGDVGHRLKRQLTAMGDTVNVASRVEAQAKELGTAFLASWEAVAPVRKEVIHSKPFRTKLRGQTRSHSLVKIIGLRSTDAVFVVQSTFARVIPKADIFAQIFYEHLFRLDPSLYPMFATTDFAKQRRMLLNMIGVTVQGLDRFAEMVPMLRNLGERHVGYGVRPEHYDTAGHALLLALESGLCKDFTKDVHQAWEAVFGWMRDAMLGHGAGNGSVHRME
jgi:class 3 adenylate cyclase/hemoglobin-like flavoprotein